MKFSRYIVDMPGEPRIALPVVLKILNEYRLCIADVFERARLKVTHITAFRACVSSNTPLYFLVKRMNASVDSPSSCASVDSPSANASVDSPSTGISIRSLMGYLEDLLGNLHEYVFQHLDA